MAPADFIALMKTNGKIDSLKFLEPKRNQELYEEAKDFLSKKDLGNTYFDFDYDSEPFVFNKYINGKLDRAYKICIFEYGEEKDYTGQTSKFYINGMPMFYDPEGNIIKNSLN
jgi:hypothetical protein